MKTYLDITSEKTKSLNESKLHILQNEIGNLNDEQLKSFRKTLDPDNMGFNGKEGI